MLRNFNIGLLLLTCFFLYRCNGQTLQAPQAHQNLTNTLSDDFNTSMPFYYGMPKKLVARDTSPAFEQKGQKILLTGTVYERDGKTPASNVILYYYQTDTNGIYATKENEERNMPKNTLGQTHGYIRGWAQTDEQGAYSIYTLQPDTYPSRDEAAHIHITVKENNIETPYYIDNFVFDDDPLLTSKRRKKMDNRGGSGIIRFVEKEDLWIGERNIILGLNIPEYPIHSASAVRSGKNIGEAIHSFTPFHAYGADKGTTTCPVCKYGWYHGILYFVGNNPNWKEIKAWLLFLDSESQQRGTYLNVYFVYGNESNYTKENRVQELETLGGNLGLKKIALTFVPSFEDKVSEVYLNKINPNVENTFLLYKRSTIIDNYVNLQPNQENFKKIRERLDETTNEYFTLLRAGEEK